MMLIQHWGEAISKRMIKNSESRNESKENFIDGLHSLTRAGWGNANVGPCVAVGHD